MCSDFKFQSGQHPEEPLKNHEFMDSCFTAAKPHRSRTCNLPVYYKKNNDLEELRSENEEEIHEKSEVEELEVKYYNIWPNRPTLLFAFSIIMISIIISLVMR